MPASGRILRGSLSSVGESGGTSGNVAVKIIKNGRSVGSNILTKPGRFYSYTQTCTDPTRLAENDRINFITHIGATDATNSIASLMIELDL